jgi:hypothetical protein
MLIHQLEEGTTTMDTRDLTHVSEELVQGAKKVQDETFSEEERETALQTLNHLYHNWYQTAMGLFIDLGRTDEQQKFEQEYQGNLFSPKIAKFLSSGTQISPLFKPETPNLFVRWAFPHQMCFVEPLRKQCNILATAKSKPLVASNNSSWQQIYQRIIRELIIRSREISNTNSTAKRGLTYEHLALVLIVAVEGLSVIGQDIRSAAEETDLLISNQSADVFWHRLGDPILIECKNWDKPVGAAEITIIDAKMDRKRIRTGILLSREGITGDQYQDAVLLLRENMSKHGRYLIVIDENDLTEIIDGVHPADKLKQKYYSLLKI